MSENPRGSIRSVASERSHVVLNGRWLIIARLLWVTMAVSAIGVVVLATPRFIVALQFSTSSDFMVDRLVQFVGLPAYAALSVGWNAACLVVAALIFWRASRELMAVITSVFLITFGFSLSGALNALVFTRPDSAMIGSLTMIVVFGLATVLFCLFPTGRFVPRWTRWLGVILLPWALAMADAQVTAPTSSDVPLWGVVGILVPPLAGVLAQIQRYARWSSPLQRQQSKWVMAGIFGLVLGLSLVFASWLLEGIWGLSDQQRALEAAGLLTLYLGAVLVPVALAMAVLRYRLWDIDFLINQTLVYGALTTALAVLYFASIVLLQQLLRFVSGQTSDIAIVVSTLMIAILFYPLRHQIQVFIDGRFYRRKYDAARTLASFSAALRDEVDLAQLGQRLVVVVEETMQPSHVSLWLRPASQAGSQRSRPSD